VKAGVDEKGGERGQEGCQSTQGQPGSIYHNHNQLPHGLGVDKRGVEGGQGRALIYTREAARKSNGERGSQPRKSKGERVVSVDLSLVACINMITTRTHILRAGE